jgi:hypoxanthine phosphoribosyltransferase
VLVVDDVLDTGWTARAVLNRYQAFRPRSLELAVLADKAECREAAIEPAFVGFDVPGRPWLVGSGMDDAGKRRQFRGLAAVPPAS